MYVHKTVTETKMAFGLSLLIGLTAFVRASLFRVAWGETIAITTSVCVIVASSVAIGSTLPLCMKKVGIDPGKSEFVLFYHVEFVCSYEVSMIWQLYLNCICLRLIVFATHMY